LQRYTVAVLPFAVQTFLLDKFCGAPLLPCNTIAVQHYCSAALLQCSTIAVQHYCSAALLQCSNIAWQRYCMAAQQDWSRMYRCCIVVVKPNRWSATLLQCSTVAMKHCSSAVECDCLTWKLLCNHADLWLRHWPLAQLVQTCRSTISWIVLCPFCIRTAYLKIYYYLLVSHFVLKGNTYNDFTCNNFTIKYNTYNT